MALICEFGSESVQVAEGYAKRFSMVRGTDQQMAKRFSGQDVRLVRGEPVDGEAGGFDFAVFVPTNPELLGNHIISPFTAIIDGKFTGIGGCSDAQSCALGERCIRGDRRLKCCSKHMDADKSCRFFIPGPNLIECRLAG